MKTQIELIAYYSNELNKVIKHHGANSDATIRAFFRLQAAKIGVPKENIFEWASSEFDRLHNIAISCF